MEGGDAEAITRSRVLREGAKARSRATYADDPYTWALEQAELLRNGRLDLIDRPHLADEISALRHYLTAKLRSDLSRVLQHLLKWDRQPERRTRSWATSIREHRRRVAEHLQDGPGLKSASPTLLGRAYADGRNDALEETKLPPELVPETCPNTWDKIMTRPIDWPEAP